MTGAFAVIAGLLGAALIVGFGGAWHPVGDSLAVFRVPLLVVFALVMIWAPFGRALRWGGAVLALAGLVPHVAQALWPAQVAAADVTVYQQNLRWDRQGWDAFLDELAARDADIVTLQEVSAANLAALAPLTERYRFQHHCPFGETLGEAVLSRHPFQPGSAVCSTRDGVALVQVLLPQGPLWVASVHLNWPWPYAQADQAADVLPFLEARRGPIVVAGDFNAVAWSRTLARFAQTTGTARLPGGGATFRLPGLGLPVAIDHVLWRGMGDITRLPRHGSDHHGLLARLVWP